MAALMLLVCLFGFGDRAQGQTASFSGVTTAIDTTDFTEPQAIASDASGDLFIVDAGTLTVSEMTRTAPGTYGTPVALTSPTGGYTSPKGVAIDSNGNLWVADLGNYPTKAGQVYELAYNSTSHTFAAPVAVGTGWQAPWTIAPDTLGDVFVTDNSASTITEISSGTPTVVNSGAVQNPRGIAVDSSENLYVVNGNTGRVMELASPYTVATQVNSTEFSGPGDLALDASGNIWLAEYSTNLVRELTASSTYATVLSWGAGLNGPIAVLPDGYGNILVSDYNNHAIKTIATESIGFGLVALGATPSSQTLQFTFYGTTNTTIAAPEVVTQGATGKDFVDAGTGTCTTTNGTGNPYAPAATCTVVVNFQPKTPGIRYGAVELLNTSGTLLAQANLYGAGTGPQIVFNAAQAATRITGFTSPQKVAVDGSGNLFIADSSTSKIYEISAGTSTPTAIATTFSFSVPYGIAVDGAGNLFVSESGTNQIDEILAAGGYTTVNTLAPKFGAPIGLAIDFNDNLYVADASSTHAVEELTAANGYSVIETLSSAFTKPFGVAVDASGNVFVADEGTTSITELVAVNGQVPASPTTHTYGTFTSPAAVALDAGANLYVADNGGGTITELTAASSYATPMVLASGASDPAGVIVDSKGNVDYTTNGTDNSAYELDLADAPALTFPSSPYLVASSPKSLTISNIGSGTGSALDFTGLAVSTLTANAANSFAQVTGTGTPADCTSTSALASGSSCNLSISFTPQYAEAISGTATLTDNTLSVPGTTQTITLSGTGTQATPTITWATPAAITYGTALSSTQLDASSTVAGSFAYTPAAGTVLGAGTQTLSVTLTPTDATNYTTATQTVQLVVNKATPTVTWATPAAITYGTALSSTQLDASSTVAGTYVYTPAVGTVLGAGTQTLSVTFTPTDTTDYTTATQTVQLVVNKAAAPTITWATPAAITYGTALSSTQLDASTTISGTFVYTPAAGTVLAAGTQTLSVTFNPTDSTDYSTATQTVQLVVNKATPAITWATPAAINYGTALSSTQLNASSTVAGTFAYTPAAGTVLGVGTQTLSVTFTPTDTTDYATATQTVQLVVNKATPTITWAAPSAINYGTALSSTQLDASSTVGGSFVYTPAAGTVLGVGTQTLSVTFTPTNTTDYTTATQTVPLVVNKAGAPTITWPTPAAITYGTALSSTQLDATTTIPGTFVYTPPAGTVLQAGTQTLSVTFNPTDSTDYPSATQIVQLVVNKATPTVTWAAPAAITYGTALSGTQLNATASVPGTFVYTPAAGTVLTAGTQTLSVTFTPTDATDYASVTQTVQITVNQSSAPAITWAAPAAITYGTALSSTQLDATTTIPGAFVYAPAAGTLLAAGVQTLSVTFTPTDTTDYTTATKTVQITVNKATPTIAWSTPAAITYGTALSATQLDATSTLGGTFVYTPSTGAVLNAGTQTLSVTLTPTNSTDYSQATQTVSLTVNQAPQTITFAPPASVAYGSAPITLTATGGGSGNPVTFTLVSGPATLTGSTLTFTGLGTVVVDANQAGNSNYLAATQVSKSINVTNAVLTVAANNASRAYGAANPTFTGTVTGAQNGNTFTETFSTTATSNSPVGTYAIVPAVTGSNLAAYTVNIQNGTLTVTQASTTTTLAVSSSSINPGQSVTLTATVASSTTGTPTGTVSFYDGSTLLGTGTLSSGTASYSATGLLSGSHSITAVYGGDTNFAGSTTTTATTITVAALDFTFAVSGSSTQTVQQGASATYQFALGPSAGNYPGTVTFAATGQPAGATVTFSPSSVAVTGGQQNITATVATAAAVGANAAPAIGRKLLPLGLAFILLPLAGARRMRRYGRGMTGLLSLLLLLAGLATTAAVSGCGGSVTTRTQTQSYTITVTATGGNVQHAVNVTLDTN